MGFLYDLKDVAEEQKIIDGDEGEEIKIWVISYLFLESEFYLHCNVAHDYASEGVVVAMEHRRSI
jgi:hypothetical protein